MTEICQTCSKLKHACQACMYDLSFDLPIEVRDRIIGQRSVIIPKERANRDYWMQIANANVRRCLVV